MTESGSNSCVQLENVTRSFKTEFETREILRGVTLQLSSGQSLAITGPSGSGKTTLLNIIGTLEAPSNGTVNLFGTQPFALSEAELAKFRNQTIGFVFQAHHLLPQRSVFENVLLPTMVKSNADTDALTKRALRLLERVGLSSRMNDRPARLSGGERQRAAVVRALINSPRLILADEPTGSLDQSSAHTIGTLLTELISEENVALIVVTHTPEIAQRMNRRMRLQDGILQPVS